MKLIYKKGSKILTNKYFLYFVFIITFIYLFQLILSKKINIIILFGLISYIIFCFNKNMAIVLGVSLIITYITTLGMKLKEGFDNTISTTDTTTPTTTSTSNSLTDIQTALSTLTTKPAAAPAATAPAATAPAPATAATATAATAPAPAAAPATTTTTTAPPADSTSNEAMNVMSNKKRNRIDYASTVQDAYEDLNSMLGQDGIKGLTLDTNRLIEQQAQLASAMKNMTPLVKTAKELLNGFNFEGMNDISNMAKQFMPQKS